MGFLSTLTIVVTTISIMLSRSSCDDRKVYIVYMGALPKTEYSPLVHHQQILEDVLEESSPSKSLVRSYGRSFNGFVAKLTERERQIIAGKEGIVSVFPNRNLKLHTTRSWDFMGFSENVERNPTMESDIVVGMIDTGVWPESKSFSDEGFGPPPKKWRGSCRGGVNFTCNNKLIGARYYDLQTPSARDVEGHGTHTASIVAGNKVIDASFYGIAQGNARGGVPSARIAVYKACSEVCRLDHILAAFDDAISDGVDIISISIGGLTWHYFDDVISIGSYHAMQKGILTSNSAGNEGPELESLENIAPWSLTVAASTTDRRIVNKVILGDGTILDGTAVNGFDMKGEILPLTYDMEKGKIALNLSDSADIAQFAALDDKASGLIMKDYEYNDYSSVYALPACLLNDKKEKALESYMNNTKNPCASISKSEEIKNNSAPRVISFSSRGPNSITGDILKPDITAPGVEILAAWSLGISPSGFDEDSRRTKFNVLSGTSMSCPHASAAAAYVKSFHLDWSPSAIKSALMTTAFSFDREFRGSEFGYGAGHIDPVRAVNPGLVYDAGEDDYLKMLCDIGYNSTQIKLITGGNNTCPKDIKGTAKDLNYPTMAYNMTNRDTSVTFTRTVTYVGSGYISFRSTIASPEALKVTVEPEILVFNSGNEKQSFVVTVSTTASALKKTPIISASLTWFHVTTTVRSPIVVYRNTWRQDNSLVTKVIV